MLYCDEFPNTAGEFADLFGQDQAFTQALPVLLRIPGLQKSRFKGTTQGSEWLTESVNQVGKGLHGAYFDG